jgi:acetyltransferase
VLSGGFSGDVYAVNPHRLDRSDVHWVRAIDSLPVAPDLAIVVTPAATVPDVIAQLGARGTRCAIVISSGVTAASGLRQRMLDAARPHLLRIVGPNCLGIMTPHCRLDATFARTRAEPGGLALISQSGALATAMLDWAASRKIGFSGVVSVGDMADVDLGDLIDVFAVDRRTEAILLYVEAVSDAAKFLSAARAAALTKPVIAIKGGKSAAGVRAALSHTGALAGEYDVYRAAFERAGIVMVDSLTGLFDAAQILCRRQVLSSDRLGIVTNGGGAGILAVDALGRGPGKLARLSASTIEMLDRQLPASWSHANPVDILGDATCERYHASLEGVLGDSEVDCTLVMHCPTATVDPADVATTVVAEAA